MPTQFAVDKPKLAVPWRDDAGDLEHDPIGDCIGHYGRWQFLMTFLLALLSFPCTFHIYAPTFVAASSPESYWCGRPQNLKDVPVGLWRNISQSLDSCQLYDVDWTNITTQYIMSHPYPPDKATFINCPRFERNASTIDHTIITEWELFCDRSYLTNLAEMMFLVGVGVGGVVGGLISDRFGRKKVLMSCLLMQTVIGITVAFSSTYEVYIVLKTMLGFLSVSIVYSGFVLSMELVGGKWVTIAAVCNFFPLPVSYIIVSGLSLLMPQWRHLQLALSLPGAFLLCLWWILPESPQWLLRMGRLKEVKDILHRAAKFNKMTLPENLDKILKSDNNTNTETERSCKIFQLFQTPLTKRTVLLFFAWFSMTLGYYGLVLNIGNLGGDLHMTSIILGVVEIPAIALSIPILLKAGRRFPIFISMSACGVACIGSVFLEESEYTWAKTVCVMAGKFSISATNIMMPMYTAELYPTLIRNLGVGASQVSAGMALVLIPYLWKLEYWYFGLPMVTIGVLSIFGGSLVLFLPETGVIRNNTDSEKKPNENSLNYNGTLNTTARDL